MTAIPHSSEWLDSEWPTIDVGNMLRKPGLSPSRDVTPGLTWEAM